MIKEKQPLVDKLKSLIGGVQLNKIIEFACKKEMSAHCITNKEEENDTCRQNY